MSFFLAYYGIGLVAMATLAAMHEDDEESIYNVNLSWWADMFTELLTVLVWPAFAGYWLIETAFSEVYAVVRKRLGEGTPALPPSGDNEDGVA